MLTILLALTLQTATVQTASPTQPAKPTLPLRYADWQRLSPEGKRAYAAVTAEGLRWAPLFDGCTTLKPTTISQGLEQGNHMDPNMVSIAAAAYAECQ